MRLSPERIAVVRAKPFPVMRNGSSAQRDLAESGRALNSVPWHVADRAWRAYDEKYRCGQTAERLAERGGFSVVELDEYYPGWRDAAGATSCEVLDHVQALAAHSDPAVALEAIRAALAGWK
jgi:hypothetical protein